MKNLQRFRWLSYITVFIALFFLWISLAAAASPKTNPDIPPLSTFPGLIHPGNSTFGITIGAIILVTIVVTSTFIRRWGRS